MDGASLASDVRSQTRMEVSTCQTLVPAAIGSAANKPLPCTALRLTSTFTFQPKFSSYAVTSFYFSPGGGRVIDEIPIEECTA